ncbi:hypothetical protein [Salinispira pacifica]|uniref:hypothetical protein n=1 Tax=Salinispira pacifica TaxID=1307761 RepID=UPI00059D1C42|nr:hypothetical protein [Salinispira pacifica]
MKKLGNLLRKDIVLGIKDVFLLLEIVFSVIFMLVLLFLIPESIRTEGHVYIWDRTGIIEDFVTEIPPITNRAFGNTLYPIGMILSRASPRTATPSVLSSGQMDRNAMMWRCSPSPIPRIL